MMWLLEIRKLHGKTQREIAKEASIKQTTYANIENGVRRPSVRTAQAIAASLGFEWTRFFVEAADGNGGEKHGKADDER